LGTTTAKTACCTGQHAQCTYEVVILCLHDVHFHISPVPRRPKCNNCTTHSDKVNATQAKAHTLQDVVYAFLIYGGSKSQVACSCTYIPLKFVRMQHLAWKTVLRVHAAAYCHQCTSERTQYCQRDSVNVRLSAHTHWGSVLTNPRTQHA
jgi:hypothetical protein